MSDVEVMQIYNIANIMLKYNLYLNGTDDEVVVDLGLQNIKRN